MKKLLAIVTLLAFFAVQQGMSNSLFDASSQNSVQQSSQTSSENSSQNSTEGSWQWSTDNSSNSQSSSEATTEGSRTGDPVVVALIVAGAVVSVAVTVGGVLLTVHTAQAKQEAVLKLQDQIYLADGKDYREILTFFELEDRDLIEANDRLAAGGLQIDSDQQAADYLAALILELTKKSEKVRNQLNLL